MKKSVRIALGKVTLDGDLVMPDSAKGIVLFAHGSGSSRFSPRNRHVADVLNKAGIATLLMDLLTKEEEKIDDVTAELRFDIRMLAERVVKAVEWLRKNDDTRKLSIGCFGASTGAAAALIAAAERPADVKAVVSRGGRPDLAIQYLPKVKAPTLLIVGGDDEPVISMNREALERLDAVKKLEIVPGATHLFEEQGKLEIVAKLAAEWFRKYLGK
ncbi:MAG TPA: dienelactone hydrolase family protein [Candidatus Nanoarchaeia archaeon]|nr:dienelactone hydrolase family protein [Candidatus Nanoarchaeia archaeon]